MDDWSFACSIGQHEDRNPLYALTVNHECGEHHGLKVLLPDELTVIQESLSPGDLFNDIVGLGPIKIELEQDMQSSTVCTRVSSMSIPNCYVDGFRSLM